MNIETIRSVLRQILIGKIDYCGLCFKNIDLDESFSIEDDVILSGVGIDTKSQLITIKEILATVLGHSVAKNITSSLCRECSGSAIASFMFINMCKINTNILCNSITKMTKFIKLDRDENDKSICIHIDKNDLIGKFSFSRQEENRTLNIEIKHEIDHSGDSSNSFDNNVPIQKQLQFKCDECSKCFNSQKFLDRHCFLIHQPVTCKKCNEIFKNKKSLKHHNYMNHNENKTEGSNYICNICSVRKPSQRSLNNHYVLSHMEKTFECHSCTKKFHTDDLLNQHVNDCHTSSVCSHCGKIYCNKHFLKTHELTHNSPKVVCPTCGKSYKTTQSYKNHIKNNNCNRARRQVSTDEYFTCDYCNKKYCTLKSLKIHIKFEHGDGQAHICIWCNKKCYSKSQLQNHTLTHTKVKDYTCEVCDGKFVSKASLLYHTRTHTGECPYKCKFCDRSFLSSSRRTEHVRRHHLPPSLPCGICPKKFKNHTSLKKHRKRHSNPNSSLFSGHK